jgi:hypothetical protein
MLGLTIIRREELQRLRNIESVFLRRHTKWESEKKRLNETILLLINELKKNPVGKTMKNL